MYIRSMGCGMDSLDTPRRIRPMRTHYNLRRIRLPTTDYVSLCVFSWIKISLTCDFPKVQGMNMTRIEPKKKTSELRSQDRTFSHSLGSSRNEWWRVPTAPTLNVIDSSNFRKKGWIKIHLWLRIYRQWNWPLNIFRNDITRRTNIKSWDNRKTKARIIMPMMNSNENLKLHFDEWKQSCTYDIEGG